MHALIIGATGATGSALLTQLLADQTITKVSILVRKPMQLTHDKLRVHLIDFDNIEAYRPLIAGDVLFCCLGTTAKAAGSKQAQWKIEHDYSRQFAQIARENDVSQMVLVSAHFANPNSSMFYTKLKGKIEMAMRNFHFPSLLIVRPPSLVRPNTDRIFEDITVALFNGLARLGIMQAMHPIPVDVLAKAMIALAKKQPQGVTILESPDIWDRANKA